MYNKEFTLAVQTEIFTSEIRRDHRMDEYYAIEVGRTHFVMPVRFAVASQPIARTPKDDTDAAEGAQHPEGSLAVVADQMTTLSGQVQDVKMVLRVAVWVVVGLLAIIAMRI